MLKLFRGLKGSPNHTPVSMVGARPGDAILFCGASHAAISGEVGAVTGLNGQTAVVDPAPSAGARVSTAAAAAGALLDFVQAPLTNLPFKADHWDATVLVGGLQESTADGSRVLGEAIRVTRPGGRLIVFEPGEQSGWLGRGRVPSSARPPDTVLQTLAQAGLRAARLLADVDGVRYFEAVKPR